MTAYIIGRLTGKLDVKLFANANMVLQHIGYTVLDPAELPGEMGDEWRTRTELEMLEKADAVCILPNWKQDEQKKAEKKLARRLRKRMIVYEAIDVERR